MTATLLAVPNVSEGRDAGVIRAIAQAFGRRARLLDVHSDPDHHRTVFTLAGPPGALAPALLDGAREALRVIDLRRHIGVHPRVGALDVAPIVYVRPEDLGPACAETLVLGDMLGHELGLPVFLYGQLAEGRTRADLRRGGPGGLAQRIRSGELSPDFGPSRVDPGAGAALVAARPPLVAFNVELAEGSTVEQASSVAARIREGGPEGLASVRAIGLWLEQRGVAQISMNVEDHRATPLATALDAIARHVRPVRAEVVGLPPRAALEGLPAEIPLRCAGTLEDALQARAPRVSGGSGRGASD